jgi:hypothetical protein
MVASPALVDAKIDTCALHVDLTPMTSAVDRTKGGAAPADIDFGLYPMSVLGIENTLRRDGAAIDEASDRSALTTGPLACVVDSLRGWERAYPADPWIAKDLLTLEQVYLRAHGSDAHDLAARAETWLERDYPESRYVAPARLALGTEREPETGDETVASASRERPAERTVPESVTSERATPQGATLVQVVAQRAVPQRAAPTHSAPRPADVGRIAEIFVVKPIALLTAFVPQAFDLVAALPEIRYIASPWDRFAPLDSER